MIALRSKNRRSPHGAAHMIRDMDGHKIFVAKPHKRVLAWPQDGTVQTNRVRAETIYRRAIDIAEEYNKKVPMKKRFTHCMWFCGGYEVRSAALKIKFAGDVVEAQKKVRTTNHKRNKRITAKKKRKITPMDVYAASIA